MHKVSVVSLFLCCFAVNVFAQNSAPKQNTNELEIGSKEGVDSSFLQNKGIHFFNIYFEWGSGDVLKPVSKRIIREEFDIKATYLYTFGTVPWLSLGLTSQFKVSPKWAENNISLGKTSLPDSFVMSANMMFGRIFDIAFGSDGTLIASLLYSQVLPESAGLKSHQFIAFMKNVFFLRGNSYSNGVIRQGWWDSSELRLQYQMRFNDYVGFRPEVVLAVIGTGILNGQSFLDNFMMRVNPRLYMYAPGGWSFFIEPRVFLLRGNNPQVYTPDTALELKFGIDYATLWQ